MTDETRKWVICGHSPDDQASLLKQIGRYYEIEYRLLKGGGRGEGEILITISSLKTCEGWDSNPRTPSRTDLKSAAFGLA